MGQHTSPSRLQGWRAGLTFWCLWVLAGCVPCVTISALIWLGIVPAETPSTPSAPWRIGQVIQTVLFLSVPQWLVLRRVARHAYWWVPATTLGWWLGTDLPLLAGWIVPSERVEGWAIAWLLLMYIPMGLAQAPVLKLTSPRAGWWLLTPVLASAVGMIWSAILVILTTQHGLGHLWSPLPGERARTDPVQAALIVAMLTLPQVMVMGSVLVWILRGAPAPRAPAEAGPGPALLSSN